MNDSKKYTAIFMIAVPQARQNKVLRERRRDILNVFYKSGRDILRICLNSGATIYVFNFSSVRRFTCLFEVRCDDLRFYVKCGAAIYWFIWSPVQRTTCLFEVRYDVLRF